MANAMLSVPNLGVLLLLFLLYFKLTGEGCIFMYGTVFFLLSLYCFNYLFNYLTEYLGVNWC